MSDDLQNAVAAELRAAGYPTSGDVLSDVHMMLNELAAARGLLQRTPHWRVVDELADRYKRMSEDKDWLRLWLDSWGVRYIAIEHPAELIAAISKDLDSYSKQLRSEAESPAHAV